jgi:NhaP-type Na+/H+ or K+/H+ antiporter
MFDALTIFEAAILATMLAATDAALGKAVITDPSVPARIREGLNVESGLNDGLCVPILFIFIALALNADNEDAGSIAPLLLVLQEIGIGLLVGVGLATSGAWLLKYCSRNGWVTEIWMQATVAGLALACFAIAQEFHGSGYVAAFTGGIMFGFLAGKSTHKYVLAAEGVGETLAVLTWLLFGVAIIGQLADLITWKVVLYGVLSLTVVRILPMYVALTGSGEAAHSRLFLGWFGPRGLASIVFAVIVLDSGLPGAEMMSIVVASAVFFSLIAHGISAKPLAKWIAAKETSADS